jgi:tetratricopeptide (TPR) repeat protein
VNLAAAPAKAATAPSSLTRCASRVSMSSTVSYVLIPADESDPIREFHLSVPAKLEDNLGALTKALNAYYAAQTGGFSPEQREALISTMRKQVAEKNKDSPPPDEAMLSQVALSQTVDIVQLLPPTAASDWMGVSMYVDDKGVAKELPTNRRASEVCTQCGLSVQVLGDAFVARAWDDQEGFERKDFRPSDLSSDEAWVKAARQCNENRGSMEDAARRLADLNAPRVTWQEPDFNLDDRLERAGDLRAEGTERFKAGDFDAASKGYEAALALLQPAPAGFDAAAGKAQVDELRLPCLLNLAACRLRQSRPFEAITACDTAVEIDAASAKAWFRRGQACSALGQHEAARKNLMQACKLAPTSREIRDEYEKCKQAASAKGPSMF